MRGRADQEHCIQAVHLGGVGAERLGYMRDAEPGLRFVQQCSKPAVRPRVNDRDAPVCVSSVTGPGKWVTSGALPPSFIFGTDAFHASHSKSSVNPVFETVSVPEAGKASMCRWSAGE